MPRRRTGEKERWAADLPMSLSKRAHALREGNPKWFTKTVLVESAIQHYVETAERQGLENLPPFKLVRPESTKAVPPGNGEQNRDHLPAEHRAQLTVPSQWQSYLRPEQKKTALGLL